jgi:hypothetical protein
MRPFIHHVFRRLVTFAAACLIAGGCNALGPEEPPRRPTPYGSPVPRLKQPKEEEPNWFESLFYDEPEPAQTVEDWVALPRPGL